MSTMTNASGAFGEGSMGEGIETSTRFNKVRMTAQCPIVFHSLLEAEKI
jgi:hypothetical protein